MPSDASQGILARASSRCREGILAMSRGHPCEACARHARGGANGVRVKSVWHAEGWRLTAWGAGEER